MATATSAEATFLEAEKVLLGLGCTFEGEFHDARVLGPAGEILAEDNALWFVVYQALTSLCGETRTVVPLRTPAQYAAHKGEACPMCGGIDIEASDSEFSADSAYQDVDCAECGYTWFDMYKLEGYAPRER